MVGGIGVIGGIGFGFSGLLGRFFEKLWLVLRTLGATVLTFWAACGETLGLGGGFGGPGGLLSASLKGLGSLS